MERRYQGFTGKSVCYLGVVKSDFVMLVKVSVLFIILYFFSLMVLGVVRY